MASKFNPQEQHRERSSSPTVPVNRHTGKKRKRNHPPQFWDTLQRADFTRRALREFARRSQPKAEAVYLGLQAPQQGPLTLSESIQLSSIASHGGYDLSGLRGHISPPASQTMPSTRSSSRRGRGRPALRYDPLDLPRSRSRSASPVTTPYSAQFEQRLVEKGIFPPDHRSTGLKYPPRPANIDELREVLKRERASLSPSRFPESLHTEFVVAEDDAMKVVGRSEAEVMEKVTPYFTGPRNTYPNTTPGADPPSIYDDISAENRLFDLKKFDEYLSRPKPDLYHGTAPACISERLRNDLGEYIIPSSDESLPAAPNFFLEAKGANGSHIVARRQAMYDGAAGARGMFQLQNYGREPPLLYDRNTYTVSATYAGHMLNLLTTHPVPYEDVRDHFPATPGSSSAAGDVRPDPNAYVTTRLNSYAMNNPDGFRDGARAFRNARDWARDRRVELLTAADAVAASRGRY